jgi:hypothetical protein
VSCEVPVEVPCTGCTLTQGYWKTHSEFGPAPYDDTWAMLPNGASTPFFLSGKTWYEVFWTPPAGNAYYNLARQYMAAKLNLLNGASSTSSVNGAIMWSQTQFFNLYTPTNWPAGKRKQALGYATGLDYYNNGLVGPGHCSEESDGNYKPEQSALTDRENDQPRWTGLPEIRVFPNPATDQITVDLSGFDPEADLSLRIYNAAGQLCQEQNLGGHGGSFVTLQLNANVVMNGHYIVMIQSADGITQCKLSVVK